uniref:Uncharacterized protein n=1 Tax=Nelumbo nucifera TaxID=4432 RepID=A0A822YGG2_NELNU|nr:TPA_asm: hypothetical protein HUJ06_009180 [Nelumbo nucifera]
MATGGYLPAAATITGAEQPVYLIPTLGSVYHAPTGRSITCLIGQNYYTMPRVVPEVYRKAPPPVYSVGAPAAAAPAIAAQAKVGAYAEGGVGRRLYVDRLRWRGEANVLAQPGVVTQYQTMAAGLVLCGGHGVSLFHG